MENKCRWPYKFPCARYSNYGDKFCKTCEHWGKPSDDASALPSKQQESSITHDIRHELYHMLPAGNTKIMRNYTDDSFLDNENQKEEHLCAGCDVREPWEHRCHGKGCECNRPTCMEKQGRITHEELMKIVREAGF
jgi:hypothetical protein